MPTTRNKIQHDEEQLRAHNEDLQAEQNMLPSNNQPNLDGKITHPTTSTNHQQTFPYQFVPLRMSGHGRTHVPSEMSRAIIDLEVGLDGLLHMTHKFYEFAFQDKTLDHFIRSHKDPHGDRFAKWIHQKLTGSTIWNEDRQSRDGKAQPVAGGHRVVIHDRTSAHVAAWHSPKRPSHQVGRHFTLADCRVWMRLHFWAMREAGIVEKSPSFADYYVRFIGHFVAVYERSATAFARESFRWSADPKNTDTYIANGREMKDVLGLRFHNAVEDIPEEEWNDDIWPYLDIHDAGLMR